MNNINSSLSINGVDKLLNRSSLKVEITKNIEIKPNIKKLIITKVVLRLAMSIALCCFCYVGYMQLKAVFSQYLLEVAWQKTLIIKRNAVPVENINKTQVLGVEHNVKPWAWSDFYPVARLSFPKTNEGYIVLNNDSGQALAFGPGISGKTPIGGKLPIVISAHNDSHFSLLAHVKIEDDIVIELSNGELSTLNVTAIRVIDTRVEELKVNGVSFSHHTEALTDDNTGYQSAIKGIILVTCYPFNVLSQNTPFRYIIEAS